MGNQIALFLICWHKWARPGWSIFDKRSCKRNSRFICIADSMGSSRIRNTCNCVWLNRAFVTTSKKTSAIITHRFDIYTFVCCSWISVINPQECADFHFIARFLQDFDAIRSHKNNFARTKLMIIRITKICVGKIFKTCTVSTIFFTNLNWGTT